MKITNGEFMDCLEKAKIIMKQIEKEKDIQIDFIYAKDLINRMALCIYDTVHDFIKENENENKNI